LAQFLFGVKHREPKKEGGAQSQAKGVKPPLDLPPAQLRQKKITESSVPRNS